MDAGPIGDYLFDAPMFVDFSAPKFTSGDLNESAADVWFDAHDAPSDDPIAAVMEARAAEASLEEEVRLAEEAEAEAQAQAQARATAQVQAQDVQAEQQQDQDDIEMSRADCNNEARPRRPMNLRTSWNSGTKVDAKAEPPKRTGIARTASARRSKKVKRTDAPSASASAAAAAPAPAVAAAAVKAEAHPAEAPQRTVPQTPTFMRRPSQKRPSMTSEERELEEIEQKRREAARLKRRSRRSFRAVHSVTDISGNEVQRSEKELTQPEPFHFATDERLRARGTLAQPEEPSKPKFHTMVTRGEVRTGPTKPRPFRFHGKPTEVKDVEPFVPMAAAVEMFQKQTPQRFRHGPAKENIFKPQPKVVLKSTIPESPAITKPAPREQGKTTAELEEDYMQTIKAFKARPVNKAVMESECGFYGVPNVKPRPCTVPMSPAITKTAPKAAPEEEPAHDFKAKPAPTFDRVFQPTYDGKHTEPHAFSVAEKYEDPRIVRERMAAQEEQQLREARAFKANPVTREDPYPASYIESKASTMPEPFELKSHTIGEYMRARSIARLQAELEELEAKRHFHAREADVLCQPAYVPAKSTRPLTSVQNVELKSDVRAKKRAEFDMAISAKEAELQRLKMEEEEQRMKEEETELLELRKKLVHKARPVPKYRSLTIKPSEQPLTEPESPYIGSKRAMRV